MTPTEAIDFATSCPFCGAGNEALTKFVDPPKHDGTLFVCAYCAAPAYMDDGKLRLLTKDEAVALIDDRATIRAILAIALGGRTDDAPKRLRWIPPDAAE